MEGQTEERFVKDLLAGYLERYNTYITPVILKTSEAGRGGIRSFGQVEHQLRKLLRNPSVDFVSTMLDFSDLPDDFPGREECRHTDIYSRVNCLEERFLESIEDARFIPYLQLQEFEALLFSNLDCFRKLPGGREAVEKLREALDRYGNPELIEKPSNLLSDIIRGYSKVLHGASVAVCIGVERMYETCPHFREWIDRLSGISRGF